MKSCETCKNFPYKFQQITGTSTTPCYICYNFNDYEPKEQEMSLFEKNLEVLKEWNKEFHEKSNVEVFGAMEQWTSIAKHLEVESLNRFKLRLKPQPGYRAFKDAKEFEPYRDRWLIHTEDVEQPMKVIEYNNAGVWFGSRKPSSEITLYQEAFDGFTWQDGTPFGIKEGL